MPRNLRATPTLALLGLFFPLQGAAQIPPGNPTVGPSAELALRRAVRVTHGQ
jgi:hypothetical protein